MGRLSEYINSMRGRGRRTRRQTRSASGSTAQEQVGKKVFEGELQALFNKLDAFKFVFEGDDYMKVLGQAAGPARDALKAEAPKGKKVHYVKENEKWIRLRPGNLRRSIQIFQSKNKNARSVLTGPVVSKKSRIKSVPGIKRMTRRNRAAYWRFVYYGTSKIAPNRFIDRAAEIAKSGVKRELKAGIEKYAKKEIKGIFK